MLDSYPSIITIKQMMEILKIGRTKAYQLIKNDDIPHFTIGKQIRISKNDILEYITKKCYDGCEQEMPSRWKENSYDG